MPQPAPRAEIEAWEPLYDLVAFGMWVYTRVAFRVEALGEFRPEPGLILVSTHRAETDVPLICPMVYRRGSYLLDRRAARLAFAARDDMFERGFFAGFPPDLPLGVRRALYPLRAGPLLPRVRVHPVPYPSVAVLRLGRALERIPGSTPLEGVLPDALCELFRVRARHAGLLPPRTAADVLRGTYADLLWAYCNREELSGPVFDRAWRERVAEGATAIRRIVGHIRSTGEMLLVFPEGRPSPDGDIGPLQPGLDLLVRRARPAGLQLLAVAYDALTIGRPRAFVACGPTLRSFDGSIEGLVLEGLRRATPLTAGQLVAFELRRAAREGRGSLPPSQLAHALDRAVERACSEGRPVEMSLAGARRHERLDEALAYVRERGLARAASRRALDLDRDRVVADSAIARLACEYESARHAVRRP